MILAATQPPLMTALSHATEARWMLMVAAIGLIIVGAVLAYFDSLDRKAVAQALQQATASLGLLTPEVPPPPNLESQAEGGGGVGGMVQELVEYLAGVGWTPPASGTDSAQSAAEDDVDASTATRLAGVVEFLRAMPAPADVLIRRSRALVPLVIAGVLLVFAGLSPLFETALVTSHCDGTVVASPGVGDSLAGGPPAAPTAGPEPSSADLGDKTDVSGQPAEPAVVGTISYPPDCVGDQPLGD